MPDGKREGAQAVTMRISGHKAAFYNCKPVYYGEYKCWGPGGSSSGRAKFARMLSDEEAQSFLSTTFLNGNSWILPPPKV
ncbi:hypothetical protein Patl1_25824 [Pistacia atlantica]|uniref:Uncharacterized protein n=1 Tax=Pistacia atlantica TaxID=434234 RepID=A0ACC1AZM1_9ROSI|nr:hypothetical protein Patl1_25824 [Pistacia atlantica]